MLKRSFFSIFLMAIFLAPNLQAQDNYWQQEVHTQIKVRLDDQQHYLHAWEEMEYINHSPDTLRFIWMHLYPNAYKNDRTAFAQQQIENFENDFYYAQPKNRGLIDSLEFMMDGEAVFTYAHPFHQDIVRIDLPAPLLPHERIKITTPFRVRLPHIFSRLGHNGQSYAISQWFPKPAVYDKNGWHPIPYLDQGEFYSEFGSYDVEITLPQEYVVLATGNLQTASEIQWMEDRANKKNTLLLSSADADLPIMKTIRFVEKNVHDFAWFADKRYRVSQIKVPYDGDSVLIQAASFDTSGKWNRITLSALQLTIDRFGKWIGPYPYQTIKAVAGKMSAGGGMEYPTITIIEESSGSPENIVIHEAGHNWFYGILASNERQHPWMDEGINSYFENRLMAAKRGSPHTGQPGSSIDITNDIAVLFQTGLGKSQGSLLTAEAYQKLNYGTDVYYSSASMFRYLEAFLGTEIFDEAMKNYYKQWAFKHPQPDDLKASFEATTQLELDWFFTGALGNTGKWNTGIKHVEQLSDGFRLTVYNHSDAPLPGLIHVYKNGALLYKKTTPTFKGTQQISLPKFADTPTHFIFQSMLADYRLQDNVYRQGKQNGFQSGISLVGQIKKHDGFNLSLLPAVGINNYDGFMAGLLLHNFTIPQKQFQYALAPLYGFKSKTFTGAGTLGYTFLPRHTFRQVIAQLDVKSFHYDIVSFNTPKPLFARYIKVAPSVSFIWKEPNARKPLTRTLQLKVYGINERHFDYVQDPGDSLFKPTPGNVQQFYGLLNYSHRHKRMINPFGYEGELQVGKTFVKLKVEGDVKISYHTPKKGLFVRGFFGKFFHLTDNHFANDRYELNTTFTGTNDYLYDGLYFGRSEREGILSRQFSQEEGGESIPTHLYAQPLGRSDNWLAALNLRSDLPFGPLPVRLYVNAATFAQAQYSLPSGSKFLYSAGLQLYVMDDFLLLQVPLIMSKDYREYYNSIIVDKKFARSIAFSVNLNNANLLRLHEWVGNYVSKRL